MSLLPEASRKLLHTDVSLFSFTNAASRPLFGLVSDYFLLRWNFPRTGWYFVITILLVVGYGAAALLLAPRERSSS